MFVPDGGTRQCDMPREFVALFGSPYVYGLAIATSALAVAHSLRAAALLFRLAIAVVVVFGIVSVVGHGNDGGGEWALALAFAVQTIMGWWTPNERGLAAAAIFVGVASGMWFVFVLILHIGGLDVAASAIASGGVVIGGCMWLTDIYAARDKPTLPHAVAVSDRPRTSDTR
jgi:hypothetical protein